MYAIWGSIHVPVKKGYHVAYCCRNLKATRNVRQEGTVVTAETAEAETVEAVTAEVETAEAVEIAEVGTVTADGISRLK